MLDFAPIVLIMLGQSRILISIAKNICSSLRSTESLIKQDNNEENKQRKEGEELVFDHRTAFFSADSTLREVMDYIMVQHLLVVTISECKFFDCTTYPPKALIIDARNDQLIGPNSITLQSLGWFPSGTIVVTHLKDHSAHHTILNVSKLSTLELGTFQDATSVDDGRACQNLNITTTKVPKVLPSQILSGVAQRFPCQGDDEQKQRATIHLRNQKKKEEAVQNQLKQNQKLLTMIQQVEDKKGDKEKGNSKQTNITSQVRKMLIKSRSIGDNANLRQEDKFFLEVIVITQWEDSLENSSSTIASDSMYCFFSHMDTVGKVASSCSAKVSIAKTDKSLGGAATSDASTTTLLLEFLIPKPTAPKENDTSDERDNEDATLWRVPNTMTLIDCQRHGFLQNFDRVIIRRCNGHTGNFAAPCILDRPIIGRSCSSLEVSVDKASKNDVQESETNQLNSFQDDNSNNGDTYYVSNEEEEEEKERIIRFERVVSHVLSSLNLPSTTSDKVATRKSTNAIEKVRQMQWKSKAQGNKRLISEEDRFYLQIIHFYDDEESATNNSAIPSAYHFFSLKRSKAIDIIACHSSGVDSKIYSSELLIRKDNPRVHYYKIPDNMTLKEAQEKGFLKHFSQVFIRSFKKK